MNNQGGVGLDSENNQNIASAEETGISMYEACLLHSRADRSLRTVMAGRLEKFDLTMMEWLLLGAVKEGGNTGITMSDAASTLDVTLPQVTALSASLSKSNLIKQKVNRQDRRSRRLSITAAGKRLLEEIAQVADAAFEEWSSEIDKDQLDTYMKTVKLFANRNNKHS